MPWTAWWRSAIALDRLVAVRYPDPAEDIGLTYDGCPFGIGRLCAREDESGRYAFAYDAYGNLTRQEYTTEGITYVTTYAYDARGQLLAQTLGTETTTYAYDPAGNLLARSLPGADHGWDYDALDRVIRDRLDTRERSYAYDPNHNRLDALIEGVPEAYSYAPASNRLTAIATPATSRVLTLDAAGNLTDDGAGQTFTTRPGAWPAPRPQPASPATATMPWACVPTRKGWQTGCFTTIPVVGCSPRPPRAAT